MSGTESINIYVSTGKLKNAAHHFARVFSAFSRKHYNLIFSFWNMWRNHVSYTMLCVYQYKDQTSMEHSTTRLRFWECPGRKPRSSVAQTENGTENQQQKTHRFSEFFLYTVGTPLCVVIISARKPEAAVLLKHMTSVLIVFLHTIRKSDHKKKFARVFIKSQFS